MKQKPDAAARLAAKIREWWIGKGCIEPASRLSDFAEPRIRSLIRREVRKERERCLAIIKRHVTEAPYTDSELVARHIVRGITKGPK